MIDAVIEEETAVVRVVSGALDVTYEVKPGPVYYPSGNHAGDGWVLDLRGMVRDGRGQAPYIFGARDFEQVVKRALSKARRLERAWRSTRPIGER